jgi:hypothetical protein
VTVELGSILAGERSRGMENHQQAVVEWLSLGGESSAAA